MANLNAVNSRDLNCDYYDYGQDFCYYKDSHIPKCGECQVLPGDRRPVGNMTYKDMLDTIKSLQISVGANLRYKRNKILENYELVFKYPKKADKPKEVNWWDEMWSIGN